MRAAFAFVLLLATFFVAAQAGNNAEKCILAKCSSQVSACITDPTCASAVECVRACSASNVSCAQSCAAKAMSDKAFSSLSQCASQCLFSATTDVFDLIAPAGDEPQLLGKCSWLKKAGCAVGIAGAIAACGGPEDIPCILAALKALAGCATCFCEDHCHGPCQALHLC